MKNKRLITIIIAIICCVVAVVVHEVNLSHLETENHLSNPLISTADEASYLRPPQNWLEGKEWKDSSTGHSSYVQRPPGYGLVFLICKSIAPKNPFFLLKTIQILAFLFSIVLLAKLLFELSDNTKAALIGASVYGLLPCFNGFMYYTLTESLSPFVLLFITLEFVRVIKYNSRPFLFGFAIAILLLLRPQLMIFPMFYIVFLLIKSRRFWWVYLLSILPFLLWQVRNYNISGSVSLHPIYSTTNKSIYRPPHEALSNLFRIWEYQSDQFHEIVGVLSKDTSNISLSRALKNVPKAHRENVRPILKEYQYVVYEQKQMFAQGNGIRELLVEEKFVAKTKNLRDRLISSNRTEYYLLTPIRSAFELMTKSHLNLFVYQKPWRGNVFIEALRYICLILINLSLLAMFLIPFMPKTPISLKLISIGVICTFMYYVFFQRMNEERYMTPLLPLMYVGIVFLLSIVFKRNTTT